MQDSTVFERLYSLCRETGCCHVLIDPQAGSLLGEAVLNQDHIPRFHLSDPLFANAPEQAPVLLRLPLSEFPLIEALAVQAQYEATDPDNPMRSVCAFIQARVPTAQLVRRLSAALDLRVDQRGIYFRYFDPRVFHHMERLLHADSLGPMLNGVSSWAYFLWDGSLGEQHIPQVPPTFSRGVRMTPQQWQMFESIEHFNAAQRLFSRNGLTFDPAQTEAHFSKVHAARQCGLKSPEDAAYYLACTSQSPQPPTQHPAWPEVLTMLEHDMPLPQALSTLCGVSLRTRQTSIEEINLNSLP